MVIRIELWPKGDEARKREIGVAHIANTGASPDPNIGHYTVKLFKSLEYAKREGIWKRGRVMNFPRLKYGTWDLLLLALLASLGRERVTKLLKVTGGSA